MSGTPRQPDQDSVDIAELFASFFSIDTTDDVRVREAAWRIRYQVYCVENPFEDPSAQADGMERDEYDAHSKQAVLFYQGINPVGCVRLVLPYDRDGVRQLPIKGLLAPEHQRRLESYPAASIAEISRYAVSKNFRRRAGEQMYPDVGSLNEADARRLIPHISLGLFRAVARLAAEHEVTTVCAAMVPALLRLLERFGLDFEPLGPPIEYHGLRQPCLADVATLQSGLDRTHAAFGRFVGAR